MPKGRPYTELEAAFCLQLDYYCGDKVTLTGYSKLWGWSKGRVIRFLERVNAKIIYPEDTAKKQNQNGLIMILKTDRYPEKNRLIEISDINNIEATTDRTKKKNGLKTDRSCDSTIEREREKELSCPCEAIVDLYHVILPELPRVRVLSQKRRSWLNARWGEKHNSQNGLRSNQVEYWADFFKYVRKSDFLMGNVKKFRADLEWLIKKENFIKVIEGRYHQQ